ncbi:MAG: squalene/phytoene synthase family protein [Elusimicrobium sp.]|jgi:farnesyl-diphosphate farnesyltransferase|nr:squalene/phytoene synthase family protein [Elusimicrobium sp.]
MEITRAELKILDNLLRRTGRTLQKSAAVLPERERIIFSTAYLLCRAADTAADASAIPHERKIFWIEKYPSIIENGGAEEFAKEIQDGAQKADEKFLMQNLSLCISIYQRFESNDKKLVITVAEKVCEGMLFDLKTFKSGVLTALEKTALLEYYCGAMGGAPGVFWSELILKAARIKMPAENFKMLGANIGDALQIVNIMRDVKEDIANGRCYFPAEDLKFFGITVKDFQDGNFRAVNPVIKKWILWGLDKISSAPQYFEQIPKSSWRLRGSVLLPALWALDTIELLAQSDVLANRIKINKKKIYLTILKSPKYLLSNKNFASAIRSKTEYIKNLLMKI